MRNTDLKIIRALPVFAGLDDAGLEILTRNALLQRFPRETRLFEQGQRPDFLHVLIQGTVELTGTATDGRETAIEIVTGIDLFILAAVLTDAPYLMGAKVLEPSQILLLPAASLREQLARQPQLGQTMLASMAQHYRALVRQLKDLKLRTGTKRLAAFLLGLERHPDGRSLTLPYNKKVLADRLGMSAENLSRAFATLRDFGVAVRGATIVLGDPDRLAEFCDPDILIDEVERDLRVPLP